VRSAAGSALNSAAASNGLLWESLEAGRCGGGEQRYENERRSHRDTNKDRIEAGAANTTSFGFKFTDWITRYDGGPSA
jgi:hypothetical protein